MSRNGVRPPPASWLVVGLCWCIVVFDGYDLIVYGTVLPELLDEPSWELTPSLGGLLGSAAFAGMMLGALGAGALSDRFGRRRAVLLCTAWFSACTVLCAVAWDPLSFGLLRFLAGIGLGGLVPAVNALAAEVVAPHRHSMVATLMMSGVPIGGSAAALLGKPMIPAFGWPSMFLVAGIALVVVLPLCWWLLPESAAFERARAAPGSGSRLLSGPHRLPSVLFALATLATLFAWFGLGTWLPELMRASGSDLGSALGFLLALNLGAVAGSLITAWAGDRFGPVRTGVVVTLLAAVSLAGLLAEPSSAVTAGLLVVAGVGTHGAQCLIIAAIAGRYPAELRGTALGWALGVGRIGAIAAPQVGGWLLAMGLGVGANFVAFALGAAVAGALLWACPRAAVRAAAPETAPARP